MGSVAHQLEAPNPFAAARVRFEQLLSDFASTEAGEMTHAEAEEKLMKEGRAVIRQVYQDWFDDQGLGHVGPAVKGSDEVLRTPNRSRGRNLESVFGQVRVTRLAYSAEGHESLHPLDAKLNLPLEKYSHAVRKRVALEAARTSFAEAVETVERTTGAHVPKRQAEELCQRSAVDFDGFYAQRCRQAREDGTGAAEDLLVLTVDGKAVPMLKAGLRPATRRAAERSGHTPKPGQKAKKKKNHRKREAMVAAVYGVERFFRTADEVVDELWRQSKFPRRKRPKPQNKVVWASLEKSRQEVVEDLFEEAESRDPEHDKQWLGVVDGLAHPIELLRAEAKRRGIALTLILDLIHALGYLWDAANALRGRGSDEANAQVRDWLRRLLEGKSSQVAASMRRSATMLGLKGERRKRVDKSARYLLKNRDMMRYDEYLKAGYPIASGVIEGLCRYLVKDRMERTGARWGLEGGEAVLQLRALWVNGDFEEYWRFHLQQEYEHNHASRYGVTPSEEELPSPSRPRLRLIV